MDLITHLVVFSVIFFNIYTAHATHVYLEMYGSTISHIINSWSTELYPPSLHNCDSLALHSVNMERVVVGDV